MEGQIGKGVIEGGCGIGVKRRRASIGCHRHDLIWCRDESRAAYLEIAGKGWRIPR